MYVIILCASASSIYRALPPCAQARRDFSRLAGERERVVFARSSRSAATLGPSSRGCILTWRTCGRDEWWSVQACKKGKRQTYFLLGRELSILRILGENRETERLSAATIAQEVVVSATSKNYCYILPPTSQQLSTQLFRWERRRFGRHADPIPHCRQKLPEKNRRNSNSNKHNKEVSLASERLVLLCFGCPIFCLDSSSRSLGLASGLFFSILWQPENEQ